MPRTLADIRTEVLGNDFDAATYSDRADQFINEAIRRVARQVRLPVLEGTQSYTTVAGSATLTLPTDDVRVVSLRNTTDHDFLEDVDVADIDDATATSGKPTAYALTAGAILLYPTPDAAYSLELRYRKDTGQLSADTDTTTSVSFPDDYSQVLVTYARAGLYALEDDAGMAQFWDQKYRMLLSEMKVEIHALAEDQVRQTPSMWDQGEGRELTWRA